MKVCGIDFWLIIQHEFAHWLFALAFSSAALFLSWAIWRYILCRKMPLSLTGIHMRLTDYLWFLGLVVSLAVVSHCIGDWHSIIPVPAGWLE